MPRGSIRKISPSDLCIVIPPETSAPIELRRNVWAAVPGLASGVTSAAGDDLEISVSIEVRQAGGSIWFRALVDGRPAQPSDVLFKASSTEFDGLRSFTFVQPGVSAGQHIIEIEATTGSRAFVMKRGMSVTSASPIAGTHRLRTVAAPSGPSIVNRSSSYQDVPHLATSLHTTAVSGIAVTFSAECGTNEGRLMIRALIDSATIGKEIIFAEAGTRGGTRSFTFAAPTVQPGNHDIRIQWKAPKGKAWVGDRTLTVSSAPLTAQRQLARNIDDAVSLNSTWKQAIATTIEIAEPVSNAAIAFAAEMTCGSGGEVFARAFLNDIPAAPGEFRLMKGSVKWTAASAIFLKKNLAPGRYSVRIELRSTGSGGRFRRSSVRGLWKQRGGSDFVQPFMATQPTVKTYRMLVIGMDPMRQGHPRPAFAQVKATFEGFEPVLDATPAMAAMSLSAAAVPPPVAYTPNLRDWLEQNSGGRAKIGQINYAGCFDGDWYLPPPEHQGTYYWDNNAWAEMFRDTVNAADPDIHFHSFDADGNNRISNDEALIVAMRPQATAYGTLRGTTTKLDNIDPPLAMPLIDLYLSKAPSQHIAGVGIAAHELCHLLLGISESYGNCPDIDPDFYSIMDGPGSYAATHLDPHSKMKAGWIHPLAINLDSITTSRTVDLDAVETHHDTVVLHDSRRVEREYFIIENRYPKTPRNYDQRLGNGSIAVWQIFEDFSLVQGSQICMGDPRYVRFRVALRSVGETHSLAWGDGTGTGIRIRALAPDSQRAQFRLERIKRPLSDVVIGGGVLTQQKKPAKRK